MVAVEAAVTILRKHFNQECEQRHTFLWLPVLFGTGILLYFQLPREPYLPAVSVLSLLALAIASVCFWSDRPFRIWLALGLIALGALTAQIRTISLFHATIEQPYFASVTGTIADIQVRAGRGPGIVLEELDIENDRHSGTPNRVRISLLNNDRSPEMGDRVQVRARLSPVPGPVLPGGYDPRRAAFFQGIGGSGFAVEPWTLAPPLTDLGNSRKVTYQIAGLRQKIANRIRAADDGRSGAVATALLVGERGYLSNDLVDDLRNAGLAHILAISGLHMGLFSGTVFVFLRATLSLSSTLALTQPIKKWSALIAIIAGFGYLMISGGNVSTYRAFIMTAIMFGAVLVDRPAISLRNLAIAALSILAFEPESIVEPGFQMSFAAVMALVAFYEWWRSRDRKLLVDRPNGLASRALRTVRLYVASIALTTIIAGLATAPIAAFHFNHAALYSVAANLAAMPILAFVVMPAGLLSLIVMPFGLESIPLAVMGAGTDRIIDVAGFVSGLEGSHMTVPSMHWAAFLVLMVGMTWTCLWHRSWRWIGIGIAMAAWPVSLAGQGNIDVLVNQSGKMVAVRDGAGKLRVSARQINQYVLDNWLEIDGITSIDASGLREGTSCDETACMMRTKTDFQVAHVRDYSAFAEECRKGIIIVTPLYAPTGCAAAFVIDQSDLSTRGAHGIAFRDADINGNANAPRLTIATGIPKHRRPWHGKAAESPNR